MYASMPAKLEIKSEWPNIKPKKKDVCSALIYLWDLISNNFFHIDALFL